MKILSRLVTSSEFPGPALSVTWSKETKRETKLTTITFLSRGQTVLVVVGFNLVSSELSVGFEYNIELAKISTNVMFYSKPIEKLSFLN